MIEFDVVLLLAGFSTRAGLGYNKVLYKINDKPLYYYSLSKFLSFDNLKNLIVVTRSEEEQEIKEFIDNEFSDKRVIYTLGGATRGQSVYNGLLQVTSDYVLIHDGARPVISIEDIQNVLDGLEKSDSVSIVSTVTESMRRTRANGSRVVERENLVAMKTPQGAKSDLLLKAMERANKEEIQFTDDVSVIEFYFNRSPLLIEGKTNNIKVTTEKDFDIVRSIIGVNNSTLIGHSKDTHRLENGDHIFLGGVKIPSMYSSVAHSDGDCLLHAVSEAIIGALAKGDLGTHYPDTDKKYEGVSSVIFLEGAYQMMIEAGYELINLDSTIYIEKPMMRPFIKDMVTNIAKALHMDTFRINVKATRGEKVGDVGQSKAVVCEAVCLLRKK